MLGRLAALLIVFAALPAYAQGTGTGTMTTLSCSGTNFMAFLGLRIPFNGSTTTISSSQVSTVFDTAECACQTDDINLELQVKTSFPVGTNGQVQLWAGTGCDTLTNRVANSASCGQVTNQSVAFSSFVTGSTSSSTLVDIPIPSANLFNPTNPLLACPVNTLSSNNFYVLLGVNGDFSDANVLSCQLTLQQNTQSPNAPTGLGLSAGDSAVSLSWMQPQGSGETVPVSYQVLCATADGQPIPGKTNATQAYSICQNGVIQRRNNYITTGTTGTDDGGTDDAGTIVDLGPRVPVPVPLGPDNLHTNATPTDDGGIPVTNSDFAMTLDPGFICSGEIKPTGTSLNVRIDGLTNNQPYQFLVVSIDSFGNPTPGPLLIGTPQPTEDLYKRFRDEGGNASGFCFIATAAFGSYEDRYVKVLRDFRDDVLLPTTSGRAFVDWYYQHSPPLAAWIAEHRAARIGTQMLLWPVIGVAALVVYSTPWQKALLCTLLVAFLLRKRIKKAARA